MTENSNAEVEPLPWGTRLADFDIDPLLPSEAVCAAEGIKARETLSRRVSRGEYPPPDRKMNGRNYWFLSTVRQAQAARNSKRDVK